MQTWLLIRALPFLLLDKIGLDDKFMDLIIHILRIMEIVFAPKIATTSLMYLENLIEDFIIIFHQLFPDINLINKFHHLQHYPECIRWFGPMILYWCMRYEGKHGQYKAQHMYNFRNSPKTLIRTGQSDQCAK